MEWRIGSLSCNIYTRDLSFSCFLSNLRYKTLVALFVAMQAFNVQSVCGYTLGGPQPKSKNQVPWKHTCWIKTLIICWSFYLQNNYNQLQFNDHLFLRIPTMRCSFEKKNCPKASKGSPKSSGLTSQALLPAALAAGNEGMGWLMIDENPHSLRLATIKMMINQEILGHPAFICV